MGDKKSLRKFMMMRGMSRDDIEDSHPELKEESIEEKKLILLARQTKTSTTMIQIHQTSIFTKEEQSNKAMKDEGNAFTGGLAKAKEMGEKTFVCAGKKYTVDEVEEL